MTPPIADEKAEGLQPPKYIIDLSLPPGQRYQEVARDFKDRVQELPKLFDDIVKDLDLPLKWTKWVAKCLLRRLHNREETKELRGISQITGIDLYLLVAFNVLLDLFMGCTSGGVRTHDSAGQSRMLHFRTLDWGMDPLRGIVVQLDYVRRPNGPIIASSLTYAGYVGVLTGVREGLSISLNFRPCHDGSTRLANFRFYFNHVMILLGFRSSISSLLREYLLPSPSSLHRLSRMSTLESILHRLPSTVTTAAYIILCDGDQTVILEKDHVTAEILSSADFVVATNHDVSEEANKQSPSAPLNNQAASLHLTGMDVLVEESISRKDTICKLWADVDRSKRGRSTRASTRPKNVQTRDVINWMKTYPIKNEETHFATIMDPHKGEFIWTQRYIVAGSGSE